MKQSREWWHDSQPPRHSHCIPSGVGQCGSVGNSRYWLAFSVGTGSGGFPHGMFG